MTYTSNNYITLNTHFSLFRSCVNRIGGKELSNRKTAVYAFVVIGLLIAILGTALNAFATIIDPDGVPGTGDEYNDPNKSNCRTSSDGRTNIVFVTSKFAKTLPASDLNRGCARIDDVKPVILTLIKTPTGKTCVLAQDNNAVHTVKAGDVRLDRFNYTNWFCGKALGYFAQITAIDFAGNVAKKFV